MQYKKIILKNLFIIAGVLLTIQCFALDLNNTIITGAEQTNLYFPSLKNKTIAVVANQTSLIKNVHLVDSLKKSGIKIKCVFAPEHGFRGENSAGEKIKSSKDKKTGIPVISLYGNHLRPSPNDLKNVDIIVFDIQDVGVRFYTYISTLQYVMEACAENSIQLIILDRPDPNGFYIDGPVLKPDYKSFVGKNTIPVVYGLTMGEYALMLNGEQWLRNYERCNIKIIELKNYSHHDRYDLPVKPSPNLPDLRSVYLYPSTCFFEGTIVSVGRGTNTPFEIFGFPSMENSDTTFTPQNSKSALHPPYEDTLCKGISLRNISIDSLESKKQIQLKWLIDAYRNYNEKENFFTPYFEKLAGTDELRKQIEDGKSEEQIRESWQPALRKFIEMRKKYLLYPD